MPLSLLPITIVPTKSFQKKNHSIKISRSLIHYWGMDEAKIFDVAVGSNRIPVNIESASITKDEIIMSEDLFRELMLPIQSTQFIAQFSQNKNTLTIGPVIGLLTEINLSDEKEPNFRSIHNFCMEMHEVISEKGGFFYVFSLTDYSNGNISGYYLVNESWYKSPVPLPDVIYNRIHSRRLEASIFFKKFKTAIVSRNIPIFNDHFLSKDKVNDLFISEEYLHPFLPETLLATEQSLEELMMKYDSIYIKPIHGSQGRNIIRVSKKMNSLQVEISTSMGREQANSFHTFSQFFKWVQPFLEKRTYIVQQGIPLIKYKNNQLDFRVLCHRSLQNSWKATSAVARISAQQQFVSNIARGGEMMKPIHVLTKLSDRKTAIQQLALMKELAVETSSIIGHHSDGLMGELGVDIGVDESGKLWIIEVNAKPSKNLGENENKIRPSTKALIEYCTFLTFSK
ncbi:YheC/YheD family protein [Bacillus sp. DTU_2020_1000418_1_SI_GHA_SEK_038]|uniref:YheC/YheD family endospore coat-associated protein n=1 Tax=Bacillus sp. DTU_2020_1000418_1_SI_GHA_SEK_038 TaxID=3077585 RepID=UPI0028EEDFAF|nr:YheC/YheD family protein [Bacillus sp. DTU_2020_1000418_1_SI_GHA_SEK_038]WNS76745.1 YheC/YheD family protein [Bacillus sp. DTU_2020_1000418_1_SI_GHA_SEK_038]